MKILKRLLNFLMIKLKIEESNKMELQMSTRVIGLLERIGDFKTLDKENNLYKLENFV